MSTYTGQAIFLLLSDLNNVCSWSYLEYQEQSAENVQTHRSLI
jgi:hypothetical protein